VTRLGFAALSERFDLLREIGSLFLVKPENLKAAIQEGYLSRLEVSDIKPYLMLRADWAKIARAERDLLQNNFKDVIGH
jgi:superfamily II DNA or RNA helicase